MNAKLLCPGNLSFWFAALPSGIHKRVAPIRAWRFPIEEQLRSAGARTYLIVAGTNTPGGYHDLDCPYGKEIQRRLTIDGFPPSFVSQMEAQDAEAPNSLDHNQRPPLPPPPENMGARAALAGVRASPGVPRLAGDEVREVAPLGRASAWRRMGRVPPPMLWGRPRLDCETV